MAVDDDTGHAVREILDVALGVPLLGLDVRDSVSRANDRRQIGTSVWIRGRQHEVQRLAEQVAERLHAVHPSHDLVALGEPPMCVGVATCSSTDSDVSMGRVELQPPDALGTVVDERAIPLFTVANGFGLNACSVSLVRTCSVMS